MKKNDLINGYRVLRDFTTAGGGLSKWTFAERGGEEFFLKEFLAPTYPVEGSPGSPETKAAKRKRCEAFEAHQNSVVKALKSRCARGGNVVFAQDFFRSGTKYYKVTDKVDVASLEVGDIARMSLGSQILILKTVAHSLGVLHSCGIVHGDLKPDNLLIKRSAHSSETYIAKLIDFDSSYFAGRPPEVVEEFAGDLVFFSPEAALYASNDSVVKGSELGLSCDIFALGLMFSLYLTGQLPEYDTAKYNYPCAAVGAGEKLKLKSGVPTGLAAIIEPMLQANPASRPNIQQVFEGLKGLDKTPSATAPKPATTAAKSGGLRMSSSLAPKTGAAPAPSPAPSTSRLKGTLFKKPGDS